MMKPHFTDSLVLSEAEASTSTRMGTWKKLTVKLCVILVAESKHNRKKQCISRAAFEAVFKCET